MKRAGFTEVRSAYEFISKNERNKIWGYGPEDSLFYKTFFTYLDRRKTETGGKPVFALLATIANHMGFNRMPDSMKMLYPKPVNIEQDYANSIHLSDHQLKDLINLINQRSFLSNTIIIITGDHSFPINEHGYSHNENGYYDESFRIPFLVLWNGRLSAQRISDCAYSQVDIAPTILDLAAIRGGRNSFMGRSLFLGNNPCKPVYLIQPYHGVYLESIRYPYKYIYHRKSGAEYMFNLSLDSSEKKDIIHQVPAELLTMMRNDIFSIFLNQRILDENVLY
jgi:phosphoglycerol transferase MdoB-like AlkP superfamily enzyme